MRKYPSLYEHLNGGFTTVMKQRVVDEFSGATLDVTKWTKTDVTGSNTFAIDQDTVDGGFKIITAGGANREANISFNNIREFSHTGCVSIWVAQATATSGSDVHLGFSNDATSASYVASDHQANWEIDSGTQYLLTSDGSSASRTALSSTTAMGTGWRVGKVECGSANIKLTIEGVLEVTKTTNRPSAALQPKFSVYGNGKTGSVRYCEAYNT